MPDTLSRIHDPAEGAKGANMNTVHTFNDAGTFSFRSGLVCWDGDRDGFVVHVNKETGQVSLPQAPHRWIPAADNKGGQYDHVLESVDVTAMRIATTQLGFEGEIIGHKSFIPL
ncbi:hypothetical protein MMC30_008011 [Trapelia coarctata]|nr:hypothetical protein [Trapelia coarctata]